MASGEIVIDANVAAKWFFKFEAYKAKAKDILSDLTKKRIRIVVPPLFVYEVESAIQQALFLGEITLKEADSYVKKLHDVKFVVETHPDMVDKAREIARLTRQERIYDSLYAALAELRGCDFWTADKKFYDVATKQFASVRFLADYN